MGSDLFGSGFGDGAVRANCDSGLLNCGPKTKTIPRPTRASVPIAAAAKRAGRSLAAARPLETEISGAAGDEAVKGGDGDGNGEIDLA